MDTNDLYLEDLTSPAFHSLLDEIFVSCRYIHFWLKGGRGSTKSSFISIAIIAGIMDDAEHGEHTNAVCFRKIGNLLKESVFEQLVWAIHELKVAHLWRVNLSPLVLTYIPTGQKILFRGCDKPKSIKSIKLNKGYFRYAWFEEVDEFYGIEELRIILQSLIRGNGENFLAFYSYNPPKSVQSWVNQETQLKRRDRLVHHSDYRAVPRHWLGEQFFIEAEHLKTANEMAYKHEYLGEITGTGGEVFANVVNRRITDAEITSFEQIRRGCDFGYAVDPFVYGVMDYDRKKKRLYIFFEIYLVGLSNRKAKELMAKENVRNERIVGDSAEPKSIDELRSLGLNITGAKKGPDSVEYGIKFLQDLEEIVIDGERCPNALREFTTYELEKDKDGNFKARFPDKNNHWIDCARYALELTPTMNLDRVKLHSIGSSSKWR